MTEKEGATWARCSLRIASDNLSPAQINGIIHHPRAELTRDFWVVDIEPDSSVHLQDQLQSTEQFMIEFIDKLRYLSKRCDISLRIGWEPRPQQDGIAISEELIKVLAELGIYVMLSTFPGA